MQAAHYEYIRSYNSLETDEQIAHKEMLKSIISLLNEPSGSYPVILGLLLAENRDFTVLLSGNPEPLNDPEFKKALRAEYKKSVYEYQKRLAIICDLCLEDKSSQYRFCGSFTSMNNIDCIAELLSVPFGVLRRLQKTSEGRRQIARVRSCAVKLKISLERMQEMIGDAAEITRL